MAMLADTIDGVIGVDTHRDTLTAAAVTAIGGLLADATASTDAAGYRQLLGFATSHLPGRRCWAIEGAGSFGAGLATFLLDQGEQVIEVPRRRRSTRRTAAKSDPLDAVHIARDALITQHPAIVRRRGDREALRVLLTTRRNAVTAWTQTVSQLKALIVSAPEELRAELRGRGTKAQITYCAALRERPTRSLEHQMTARALHATARRCQLLRAEINQHQHDLHTLVVAITPWLLELPGVGPITATQILISWSHAGRWRSEAAFAAQAGTSPIPASSGQTRRYRLNRRGDRQLNHALHTIAIVRMRDDPVGAENLIRWVDLGFTSAAAVRDDRQSWHCDCSTSSSASSSPGSDCSPAARRPRTPRSSYYDMRSPCCAGRLPGHAPPGQIAQCSRR